MKSSTSSSFEFFIHLLVSTMTAVSLFVPLRTNSKSTMSCALKRVWELFAWEHEREVKGFSSKPKPMVLLLLLLGNVDVDGGYEYCLFPLWAMYWIQCVALWGLMRKNPNIFAIPWRAFQVNLPVLLLIFFPLDFPLFLKCCYHVLEMDFQLRSICSAEWSKDTPKSSPLSPLDKLAGSQQP